MSERLLIRLHPDGRLTWLAQDTGGRPLSAANDGAPPAGALARARRIVVLVPSEQVVLLDTDTVTAKRAQLVKAVPFALEDRLASPVEDLHFALPSASSGDRLTVAVVARAAMRGWVDTLAQHGIRADVLIPETLALPAPADSAVVAIEPERALLRLGRGQAFACDTAVLGDLLTIAAPARVVVRDFRQAPRLALPASVAEYRERESDALAFLASSLVRDPEINLLQGEFASTHRYTPATQLWRRAAAAAAAALLLLFVYAGADYLRLEREADRLERAEREILRTDLPEVANVAGDPRSLMQSALTRLRGEGSGNGGVLALLGRIGPILASATRVQLTGIEYRNATLELGLRAPDVAALDLVREQLATLGGIAVEVTAANTGEKGVDGRLRISGAKS